MFPSLPLYRVGKGGGGTLWPPRSGHPYRQRILSASTGWFTLWVGFWLEEEGSAASFTYCLGADPSAPRGWGHPPVLYSNDREILGKKQAFHKSPLQPTPPHSPGQSAARVHYGAVLSHRTTVPSTISYACVLLHYVTQRCHGPLLYANPRCGDCL